MKPLKLKIKNFFSHADSELEFDFNSALLIGNTEGDYTKSNGSGKSSIFESVLWCLFNKSRAGVMNDVIKWGESECRVEFEFSVKSDKYKIIRTRNRLNSSSTVDFFKLNSLDQWQDMSGSTSTLTNSSIESEIKTDYKTFINSVYFRQNDISEFAEAEPFKKKEILKNIVDISRWDDYEKLSKQKLKDIKKDISFLEADLESADSINLQKIDSEKKISSLNSEIKYIKERKEDLSNFHKKYFEEYISIKSNLDTKKYDRIIDEISSLKKSLSSVEKEFSLEGKNYLERKKELADAKKSIDKINSDLKNYIYTDNVNKLLSEKRDEFISISSDIKYLKEKVKEVSSKSIKAGICNSCNQEICEDYAEEYLKKTKLHIKNLKLNILENQDVLDVVSKDINNLESSSQINNKIDSLKKELSYKKNSYDSLDSSFVRSKDRVESLKEKRNLIVSKIGSNEIVLNSLKDDTFKSIKDKLKSVSSELEGMQSELIKKTKELGFYEQKLIDLNSKLKELKKKGVQLSKQKELCLRYELLSKYFGKGGVQTILLENIISDLQNTSNKILKNICNEPLKINFETQRTRSDGVKKIETLSLNIIKDGFSQDFRSLSGGEKFRIALSLRIGLSELSSRYGGASLEFIMMDEVNSPLDRFGVETLFVSVIKSLEDNYKIMVITHDESLKEKFDNVIDVTKVNGESSINITSF